MALKKLSSVNLRNFRFGDNVLGVFSTVLANCTTVLSLLSYFRFHPFLLDPEYVTVGAGERVNEAACPIPNSLYSGNIFTGAEEFDPIYVDTITGGNRSKVEV